ncbi:hypothetical protein PIIN_03092 [Serendipita indica DSM 11827]|uniref:NAD(P)-binding domain-containing protein n=1 Tax=Serendipita indica (strain DSM 11827) TaxID=1109443 RepID=G4TD12_SERID|nr:hypothetical protein PIIN_03092 [Serendipita indica DSM 11827]
MIILTGTTGNLGSRVLKSILARKLIPPSQLIISTSNPDKAPDFVKESGAEIRKGDFLNPASLVETFRGGEVLFLVSFPSPSVERWEYHRAAIDAAKVVGVKTVIYTSLMFGGETGMKSVAGVQQAHIKTVDYLVNSGLDYIVIREGIYAESWWLYAGFLKFDRNDASKAPIEFVMPGDGEMAWKEYIGQTIRLTGSRTATMKQVATLLEEKSGRPVEVRIVSPEEAARYHKERKVASPFYIDSWSGWFSGIKGGECAVVDPTLERILGRKPRGIEEMADQLFGKA